MWRSDSEETPLTEDEEVSETRALNGNIDRGNLFETFHDDTIKRSPPRYLLPAAASVASLGGILFGYDIGIISGAMLQLKVEFNLSCRQQEMIVTTLIIGGLVASLFGGQLLDKYGRKTTIIINAFIFLLGAMVLTFSHSYVIFIVGRFILGFAVSLSAVGDCVYISEIASPNKRGLLVSLNELGITLGLLLAYLVNFLLINTKNGWRYMFGISSIPAVFQIVGMIFLPSSPRWLITKGKEEKAKNLIGLLWPNLDKKKEVARLKVSLSSESSYNFLDLFGKRENLRMRMFVGIGIVFFQQLTGQPTVLYYAPALFKTLGFDKNVSATLATVGLGVVKVVFTFITLCTVDKLGRRTFLLLGAVVMTASLVTLSALTFGNLVHKPACGEMAGTQKLHTHLLKQPIHCFNITNFSQINTLQVVNNTNNINIKNNSIYNSTSRTTSVGPIVNNSFVKNCSTKIDDDDNVDMNVIKDIPNGVKYACLVALMFFVIGYAVGYGPMSWLILTEIFPTGIKGRAVATATCVNWGTNILISMTFLDVIGSIGPFWTFLIYAMIGVISIFFLFHFVPETKGKSLETISAELNKGVCNCGPMKCCGDGHAFSVEDEHDNLLYGENNSMADDEAEYIF